MKWFDKVEIKDKESLTTEDVAYLLKPSLTINVPFNCLIRKHFDYLLAFTVLLIGEAILTYPEEIGILSLLFVLINTFLQGWMLYFFTKHSRRLAWNRNQWKDIEQFKKSERKWFNLIGPSLGLIAVRFYQEVHKETDPDAIIGIGVVAILLLGAMLLPFFQAWRAEKREKKDKAILDPTISNS